MAEPILVAVAALPKVTLYSIVLLVVFATLHGVVPIALFTIGGVRAIPRVLRQTGRAMNLSRMDTVRHILVPAALPEFVSGLRLGTSLTLLGTLVAEMFAAPERSAYAAELRKLAFQDFPDRLRGHDRLAGRCIEEHVDRLACCHAPPAEEDGVTCGQRLGADA